jgi:mannitol/fructose-specific phosphotransferase system IIA component (Ntr-type)
MSFVERLRPELIVVRPAWETCPDAVRGLVSALVANAGLASSLERAATEAVLAREAESSTALLDIRVGVPHARLAGLEGPVAALALSDAGLYEAVPTVRIQIVALVLSPPAAVSDHLAMLAGISTLLRSAALRTRLLAAPTAEAAFAVLAGHGRAPS